MSRQTYAICFVILAFIFVPVIFPLGAVSMVGPCSYVAFVTLPKVVIALFQSNSITIESESVITYIIAFYFAVLIFIYCGLFYVCSRFTFRISQKSLGPSGPLFFQIVFLCIVLSCSFLNVIHSDSFVNSSGTYNFWTGAIRLFNPS